MKSRLSAQGAEEREKKSRIIRQKLFDLPVFRKARCVWFYAALPTEVNTLPMIDQAVEMGKRVLVPLTDLENKELKLFEIKDRAKDLRPGTLGILEPRPDRTRLAALAEVNCAIVPGLVFDKANRRIGHGAGLYDRSLAKVAPGVSKIGLAFSFQVLQEIPHDSHDQILDFILTD